MVSEQEVADKKDSNAATAKQYWQKDALH